MKLTNLLQLSIIFMLLVPETSWSQAFPCFSGLQISLRGSDAESAAICQGDGEPDVLRFTANLLVQPVGYVVVDEDGVIVKSTYSNIIDLEGLPTGNLRVYGFYYKGSINDTEGQLLSEASLATGCYNLSVNSFPVASIIPDGQTVSTDDGLATVYTCPGDGVADVVSFTTTSTDPNFTFVVTDENNIILDFVQGASYDFDGAPAGTCRVWGVSAVGDIATDAIGEDIQTVVFSENCFDLSDNYVEIIRSVPEGGSVSLSDGTDAIVVCTNEESPGIITFGAETASLAPYTFLLTDGNNEIQQQLDGNTLDPAALPVGISRIWGLSFTGNLTFASEDIVTETNLSDDCFELSGNFIEITKKDPDGGNVSLADGTFSALLCVNDGVADELTFANTSAADENYVYLVTGTDNVIQVIVDGDTFDFDPTTLDTARVWGLSYSGNLLATVGADAAAIVLSDECYELSGNFVTVINKAVDGASVSLADGSDEQLICVRDGVDDILEMTNTSAATESYTYLITDENNNILDFSDGPSINLENTDPGVCRIWGLSYSGSLMVTLGENAATALLSNECFDLSDNFVTVTRKFTEGGTVSLANDGTEALVCVGDGIDDILNFTSTGAQGESFIFVVTDDNNNILDLSETGEINFEGAEAGVCRVWGLAYSGTILAQAGDNAAEVTLTDECYSLSDNFVTITRQQLNGATVALEDGATDVVICVQDGADDLLAFTNTATPDVSYAYLVTDENNVVLNVSTEPIINFEAADPGICRVWGVAYSGNLTVMAGDDAAAVALSDQCYDLSDNFVTLNRKKTVGGSVALDSGETEIFVCVGDGNPDILTFTATGAEGENFIFIITDENNVIEEFSLSGIRNFESFDAGVSRVWGLAYTGFLTAEVGDDAAATALSNECFDLSDNFVTVDRRGLNGGTVSLAEGGTEAVVCLDGITPDLLSFTNTSTSPGSYVYVVTDENNIILSVSTEEEIDFSAADPGICRVWGLSFTGNLIAQAGDDAAAVALSDQCFDLSDNFVTVSRKAVDGATVSLEDGATEVLVCSNDEPSGLLSFVNTSTAGASYGYVITDTNNEVLVRLQGSSIDFSVADPGEYRVWGFSYTGTLLIDSGANPAQDPISDECFDLSDNFITIRLEEVEGGTVGTPAGSTVRYTCPGDGAPDIVSLSTTGSSDGSYVYVVTDENNIILEVNETGSIDFEAAGTGISRIWGLAYTGALTAMAGDDAAAIALSDACFDLSDNFITVIREQPNGGTVSMPSGDTLRFVCPGDDLEDIVSFDSTGTSNTPYGYIITDENNIILAFAEGDQYDFNDAPNGVCRVWGLAYVGDIIASVGEDAAAVALASECFDLSDNFIEIWKTVPDGGTLSFADGSESIDLCANSDDSSVVQMSVDGASPSPYVFVILEENDDDLPMVVAVTGADTFDFATLEEKNYLIRGLAYTGNLLIEAGGSFDENAALSDDCYALSDNILDVNTVQTNGGDLTVEGFTGTDVTICVGDGAPDSLIFVVNTDALAARSTKIITDSAGIFLTTLDEDGFNFENSSGGIFLVYHVSYTGFISLSPGDDIDSVTVASGCFDLSPPVTVDAQLVDGGRLLLSGSNQTLRYVCANDGIDDIISVFNTSSATEADYKYLLAADGIILAAQDTNVFNLTDSRFKSIQLWGVSYTGTFNPSIVGQLVENAVLSDGCYVLSDNPVQLYIDEAEGGVIAAAGGATELSLCIGADESVVELETSSGSSLAYDYVLTTGDDRIIRVIDGESVDFAELPVGLYHIWAVSYGGTATLMPGAEFLNTELSSSCFDRSANFIEVIRFPAVSGGSIFSPGNDDTIYACPGNGLPDIVSLFNTGAAPNDEYTYLITDDEGQVFIPSFTGNVIDFDPAPEMIYRIYGISYHGDLLTQFGTDIFVEMLADSCWELSDNFLRVINESPEGGTVSTEDGETTLDLVQGDALADSITFINTSTSNQRYVYVVTDEENVIDTLIVGDVIDFELFDPGTFRVWGLSYTGNITAMIGDDADEVALTDDCYDLSANFVTVNIGIAGIEQAREPEQSITHVIEVNRIVAAPNPALDWVNLRIELSAPAEAESTIHIFNANGQLVYQNRLGHTDGFHTLELNTSSWRSGIYAVRVQNGREVVTERFVKQE